RGWGPFLNTYGDGLLVGAVRRTPPLACNPRADAAGHSAVPHKYVTAYLLAIKSLLRYHGGVAVSVHDDGSLREADKALIAEHVQGVTIIDRREADERFNDIVNDPFLQQVRNSYTSYVKLFDPSLVGTHSRIMVLDTDTLFLRRPDVLID